MFRRDKRSSFLNWTMVALHQASPQSSSLLASSFGFGLASTFFTTVGFGLIVVLANFFAPAPAPIEPVVVVRAAADGLEALLTPRPFASGFLVLAADWAASQPAKSGSPPSSCLTVGITFLTTFFATGLGDVASGVEGTSGSMIASMEAGPSSFDAVSDGVSKSSFISSISPQASKASSSSFSEASKMGD